MGTQTGLEIQLHNPFYSLSFAIATEAAQGKVGNVLHDRLINLGVELYISDHEESRFFSHAGFLALHSRLLPRCCGQQWL